MNNLFITGLNGRTGKYFLEELMKNNHLYNIYASYRREGHFPAGINAVYTDLDAYENVVASLKNMDVVFHISGIQKSVNIVKACLINHVQWVILVHTTGIYSKYKSAKDEYLKIEKEIEELTKDKNIAITILRPTMIFGSLDDQNMSVFIKMVDRLKFFPVVNGAKYALQPVSQKDLGKAYYQVLINRRVTANNTYDLSGEKEMELMEILKIIARYLNKKPIFINVPYFVAYSGSIIVYYLTFKKIDYREKVQRLVEPRAYSHQKATDDFGYKPLSFEKRIREEISIYQNNKFD